MKPYRMPTIPNWLMTAIHTNNFSYYSLKMSQFLGNFDSNMECGHHLIWFHIEHLLALGVYIHSNVVCILFRGSVMAFSLRAGGLFKADLVNKLSPILILFLCGHMLDKGFRHSNMHVPTIFMPSFEEDVKAILNAQCDTFISILDLCMVVNM